MDVQLYVYDLSQGLARQMSMQFLGTQIDAVYHTSIVIQDIEYFFGAGIQTCRAGSTHHGRPMEVISLGKTELPIDTVLEYVESLKEIYTPESYDLFMHNCNNFSNDFAMFLVGKNIPSHITSLPSTVLNTPFGQMLRPMLDQSMRRITQAPVPQSQSSSTNINVKPNHHHSSLPVNALVAAAGNPVKYTKIPPIEKLIPKLHDLASDPILVSMRTFITGLNSSVKQDNPLPSLMEFSNFLLKCIEKVPQDCLFAAYDLLRTTLIDFRVASFYAEAANSSTITTLINHVNNLGNDGPYNLRIVALQLACNLLGTRISSALAESQDDLISACISLTGKGLLDSEHPTARVAAAGLAFNLAAANQVSRASKSKDAISEENQVELAAALVEALSRENSSKDTANGLTMALGLLVYSSPFNGDVMEVINALGITDILRSKEKDLSGKGTTEAIQILKSTQ